MAILTRSDFYTTGVAIARRRRRVTYGANYNPLEYQYEQKQRIRISNTKSYEDYYQEYQAQNNNYFKKSSDYEIMPTTSVLERPTTNVYPRSKIEQKIAKQVANKKAATKKQQQQKNTPTKTPIVHEQGIENSTMTVPYKDKEGRTYYKKNGSAAWRHNNPGNLSFSSLEVAKRFGATNVVLDRDEFGRIVHRWGVFETPEAGEKAMRKLLQQRRFSYDAETGQKRTIAEAIGKIYAPAADNNNVSAYANFVQNHSGIDVYRRSIDELTPPEFNRLIEAIKARESTVEGEIIYPAVQQKNSSI